MQAEPNTMRAIFLTLIRIAHNEIKPLNLSDERVPDGKIVMIYVNDRWTKNPTNIVYFDNLVIAREYIGPAGGK